MDIMKYKHIIFDIDGTMLDSAYADLTALQRVLFELQNKKYPGEVALKQLGVYVVSFFIGLYSKISIL